MDRRNEQKQCQSRSIHLIRLLEYCHLAINGNGPSSGRLASVYSEVQTSRLNHPLPMPSVLKSSFKIVDGAPSSAAGNPAEIAKLFPSLFGQPSASVVPTAADPSDLGGSLKIGVVLSGGQAPGGHNVISGIFGE
ncbi:Pyrophosphate--fructose 6-phosphate 1-phosphotransferase subunit beta [Platanthera guangdongensis]|uniref:Pyrophosphate--fructose 6-phosphate 1-phosphotransferase subunit beta n=1 Tax=Platanthera guangdongensis TaxID=2320717 RepID=A0ABR2MUV7_9ASPA